VQKQFHIIINPVAGGGKGKDLGLAIRKYMDEVKLGSFDIVYTKGVGDAISLARENRESDHNVVVAVGGDGTINEVVNGLMNAQTNMSSICKMGVINCGSGAGFVQSFGIPSDLASQIHLFLDGHSKPVDVGLVSYTDHSGILKSRYFINECQIGFSGSVVSVVSQKHKRFGGKLAFGYVAVSQLMKYHATNMKVTIDDGKTIIKKQLGVTIGNGRYCAGGMQLTPNARLDDGLLDVLNIADMNLIQRLSAFSKVYSGKHINTPFFTLDQANHIDIDSDIPVWVEADGELLGKTPCSVRLIPGAIQIYSPINATKP
jgi:diacylglycerol kinase (ATP)